jgi:hypothetical protein
LKLTYLFLTIFVFSCSSLKYNSSTKKFLPELGEIGVYKSYLLDHNYQSKTVTFVGDPVRLKVEEITVKEREIFKKNDSPANIGMDSTLISIEVLDKISIIQQINSNKDLLKHLKKTDNYRLVSKVVVHFSNDIMDSILSSEEIYLIQNRQNTLSLELRKNNKAISQIEFSEGIIVDFNALDFCWGLNKRREAEIFDIVPVGSNCNGDTYKTAKKVEKKNEFKF